MIREFVYKIKRAETPFYARLKRLGRAFLSANVPYPRFLRPPLRGLFYAQLSLKRGVRWLAVLIYRSPLFRARCEAVGRNFRLSRLPDMQGPVKIWIGDDVTFFGRIDIYSGSIFAEPKLIIGNRVDLGHNIGIIVNREIVIEDDVNIASGVSIRDTDSHPRDTAARIADLPPTADEIKPVRICKNAWIGGNSHILKGVTIGEGAIIGVNSVVVTDVPAYCVAMGNPARVVVKNAAAPPQG